MEIEVHDDMSMEERRNFNIRRNELFLKSLLQEIPTKVDQNEFELKANDATIMNNLIYEESPHRLSSRLQLDFPCRSSIIDAIFSFLDKSFNPSPPLVLHGVGQGKTSICTNALSYIISSPVVIVRCKSYFPNSMKLYTFIWKNVLSSIANFNMKNYKTQMMYENDDLNVTIKSFIDFIEKLTNLCKTQKAFRGDIIRNQHVSLSERSITQTSLSRGHSYSYNESDPPCLVIFFDDIDALDGLDNHKGLSNHMLQLDHQFCHCGIKVLATRISCPRNIDSSALLLHFTSYTDENLIELIGHYTRKKELSRVRSPLSISDSISAQSGLDLTVSELSRTDHNNEIDTLVLSIQRIAATILPSISMRTRNLDEVYSVANCLYHERLKYMNYHLNNETIGKGIGDVEGEVTENKTEVDHQALILVQKYALEEMLHLILHQPAINMDISNSLLTVSSNASNCNSSGSKSTDRMGQVPFHKRVPQCRRDEKEKSSAEINHDHKMIESCAVDCMKEYLLLYRENLLQKYPVNIDTLCGKGWCVDLPIILRVILISAFIASNNPQETDKYTFGFDQKGRRKKTRAGYDDTGSNEGKTEKQQREAFEPRSFNVERLISIISQIYPSATSNNEKQTQTTLFAIPTQQDGGDGKVNKKLKHSKSLRDLMCSAGTASSSSWSLNNSTYRNESMILSTINTLVKRKFLVQLGLKHSGYHFVENSISPITYVCNLSRLNAEVIARSLSFPLQDYLFY